MNLCRITLLLLGGIGTVGCEKQSPSTSPPPAAAAQPVVARSASPRYQIVFSPHVRADTFLLDTQKGRVWVMVKFSDIAGEPSAFDEVEVIDNTGEIGVKYNDFPQIYKSSRPTERKGKKPGTLTLEEAFGPAKAPEAKGEKK